MNNDMDSKEEVYEQCIKQASDMVSLLVEDFDKKYAHEPLVRSFTLHLAQMYYLVQTNKNFQDERERMLIQTQQLLQGLQSYRGDNHGKSIKL